MRSFCKSPSVTHLGKCHDLSSALGHTRPCTLAPPAPDDALNTSCSGSAHHPGSHDSTDSQAHILDNTIYHMEGDESATPFLLWI